MIHNIDYKRIYCEISQELKCVEDSGEVASYIPGLGNVHPRKFGMHLTTNQGEHYFFGDSNEKFSIQSISKVFSLVLALQMGGECVFERVGVEPSGTAFNSLVQLEHERGIPRNPLISAGAIVVCDMLVILLDDPKSELLDFIRKIAGVSDFDYSPEVAESEMHSQC